MPGLRELKNWKDLSKWNGFSYALMIANIEEQLSTKADDIASYSMLAIVIFDLSPLWSTVGELSDLKNWISAKRESSDQTHSDVTASKRIYT